MNEHHYQRIDKGVPRSHNQIEQNARQQARDEKGMFLPVHSLEKRSEVILEAIEGLRVGNPTPEEVAVKHQIPRSTVYSWLIADPRASEARALFFSDRLGHHLELIETSSNPLDLARGREAFRAWADIASKRDPANYGQKQEITHVQADLGERLRRARERVVSSVDNQALESHTGVMSNPPAALPAPSVSANQETIPAPEGPIQSK